MKENLIILPEDCEISSVGEKDNVIPGDGGDCVNNHSFYGEISVPKAISDQDGALISSEISLCQEFSQSTLLNAKVQRFFNKCSTFPVSREMHAYSLSSDGRSDSPNVATQGQKSVAAGTLEYSRSISLPSFVALARNLVSSSSALVSAMKGGRALRGTIEKLDCRVKWAPEVYEPPATSMSHTLRAHSQRPQSTKKKDKRKYKGKSSRGNGSERKHGSKKNSNTTSNPANVSKSKVADVLEYNFNGQEAKCGSSFLSEGRPNVHLPIGEAV